MKDCLVWQGISYCKKKVSGKNKHKKQPGKAKTTSVAAAEVEEGLTNHPNSFFFKGDLVESKNGSLQQVKMLRDTGAQISLVAEKTTKFSGSCRSGESVFIRGISSTKLLPIVVIRLAIW